ncbi:minor tail protein [Microbacterium phage Margaery]|uniref:Minor tail protein n=1 Tax=Microbacterium phage Margaery TaxID=2591217 RepID=A0A514DHK4_9CAUD|nr:minor tail protein [Microbacterium phage Margaery]QDH93089.1 minor tail protein [Microbacterium phage Margaery]
MSIYEGYLSFGGNEIVNNTRTRGIAESASPCPMWWLKGPTCDSIRSALFEQEGYTWATIQAAPWYDPDVPQSADFFGFFAHSITEVMDSTRTVSRTEGIDHGGVLGRTRKATKTMRVRGLLMGRGRRAIEYGQTWLSAAVDPNACGQHGDECGLTDVAWFADCPPERAVVPDFTPWAETRRNWNTNPRLRGSVAGWTTTGAVATLTATPDGARVDVTAATSVPLIFQAADLPIAAGNRWSGAMDVTVPAGFPAVSLQLRTYAYGQNVVIGSSPVVTVQPGTTVRFEAPGTVDATGAATGARTILYGNGAPAGARFVVKDAIAERTAQVGTYFDGETPDVVDADLAPVKRYSWVGAVDGSASIEETRTPTSRPQTDAEYQASIDQDVRYLHDVAAISGPLITNTLNSGEFWAYEVEMVIGAERPWVYGKTRDVDLPPTLPVIIQDIPYNLVPYPSAELAAGDVAAARNLSTNPSVETNATDWAVVAGAPIALANVAGARSTALAAVGAASYRALFTAPSAGANGWFGAQQVVPITSAAQRHSINMWAAGIPLAGASVLGTLQIIAEWRNAANAILRTDTLGTVPVTGGVISAPSILPPAGTTNVVVRARLNVTSWPNAATIQVFADALAVTVP